MQKPLATAVLFTAMLFPLTAWSQEQAPAHTHQATRVSPSEKPQSQVGHTHDTPQAGGAHGETHREAEHARHLFLANVFQQAQMVDGRFMGLICLPVGIEEGQTLGLPRGTTLRIQKVHHGGPGYQAGLRNGDVLVRLNDQLLVNNPQVAALIRTFDHGETITLHFIRSGQKQSVQATLGTRKIPQIGPGGHIPKQSWRVQPMEGQHNGDPSSGFGPVPHAAGGQAAVPTQQILVDLAQHQGSNAYGQSPFSEIDLDRILKLKGNHAIRYTTMTWTSGDQKVTTTVLNDGKAIKSIDQDGKVLYEGPVQADGDYPGLPEKVQKMLKDRTKDGKLHIDSSNVRFKHAKPAKPAEDATPTE